MVLLLKLVLLSDVAVAAVIIWLTDNGGASPAVVVSLAAISAAVSIVTAVLAYLGQRQSRVNSAKIDIVKTTVDGKMSELLEATKSAENLKGAERERVEQRSRDERKDLS